MAMNLAMAAFLLGLATLFSASSWKARATTLTVHNLCPYPVWPLFTPNTGLPAISDSAARLDPDALLSLPFPPTVWAGRVTARTGCDGSGANCATGAAPPCTVALLTVHHYGGSQEDEAVYGVSLVDGFNVPMVISPQGGGVDLCTAMGCAVDLNPECPPDQRAAGGAACRGPPGYFKARCPLTRMSLGDKDALPQSCRAPGEIKIELCQPTLQGAADDRVIGTVVEADG